MGGARMGAHLDPLLASSVPCASTGVRTIRSDLFFGLRIGESYGCFSASSMLFMSSFLLPAGRSSVFDQLRRGGEILVRNRFQTEAEFQTSTRWKQSTFDSIFVEVSTANRDYVLADSFWQA